jgi:benzoyl-CoA reductase/2-hydroxyglutaryl-CoA dehydratase subunit BcrC/BadD/HgdB
MDLRYKAISEMIDRFSIDGIVFASNRSCKVYSVMQMDLKRRLAASHDIATVMIDVDHADVRKYSEEKVFIQLEAMLETIEGKNISTGS